MNSQISLPRRSFLQGIASAALLARPARLVMAQQPEATCPCEKLTVFPYSDVKLTGGPLKAQQDRIHSSYMALDEDRLLKVYRQRAGLAAPGEDMGGWYDAEGFGPGQVFGQIVSGLARFYANSRDPLTRAKVERLTNGFVATIDANDYSYPSVKASTCCPAYNLDKNLIGLLDAYSFAGVSAGLEGAKRCIKGAVRYLPPRAFDRFEAPKQASIDETYTLPENFFYAYELTGDRDLRELAMKYLMNKTYFDPLSQGENVLPGLHAYSHVNALCSACRAYLDLGETKYLHAAQNAWEMITQTQSYASGGWAPREMFVDPGKGLLGESLTNTHAHFETPCGSYAHLKLTRYLLRFTADARYGDSLERVLYNTILGIKDPQGDGHVFYYSDYHAATQKGFASGKWPCCSGTTPQVVADYTISAYFQSADGIYVNLFTPSEVNWNFQGTPVKLVQTTGYPEADATEIRLEVTAPTEFTVYVRIPGWLRRPAQIAINDKKVSVDAHPGSFAALPRRWKPGDAIQVQLPFDLWMEPIDAQHPNTVAVMWGPLMLVALDSPPQLVRAAAGAPAGLKPGASSPLTFELERTAGQLRFVPFYKVQEETYTTYVDLI